ncbi:MAG: AlpA family phage regulatory protein [Rhodanobacteraceae bacterium]|nr:AlpA family phage regulatory protein [Rhodanobacteraceae bacterium]
MQATQPAAQAVKGKPARAGRSTETRKRNTERSTLAAARASALLSGDGLLRLPEVLAVFPVSASTWWEGVRAGRYPASVKLGLRCTCWRAADVRALIEQSAKAAGA